MSSYAPSTWSSAPPELRFSVDGLTVSVNGTASLVALTSGRLAAFERADGRAPDIAVELSLEGDPVATIARPAGPARRLFDDDFEFEYFEQHDVLRFADEGAAAHIDAAAGRARILARPGDDRASVVATRVFLTLALLELAKRRGRYAVHAAAVAKDARALLIAGASGSGKTTLTLACLHAGFAVLGDDIVLVREPSSNDVVLHEFPDEISVAERSAALVPGFAPVIARGAPLGGKRRIAVADLGGAARARTAVAAAIVFPALARASQTRLRNVSTDEAFIRLVPNVMRTERVATQRHLDVLADIARRVPAYELEVDDPQRAPAQLSSLLEVA